MLLYTEPCRTLSAFRCSSGTAANVFDASVTVGGSTAWRCDVEVWTCTRAGVTLSPIIMEVENHPKWKEINIGGTHFPLNHDYGRTWEEGYQINHLHTFLGGGWATPKTTKTCSSIGVMFPKFRETQIISPLFFEFSLLKKGCLFSQEKENIIWVACILCV